MFVYQFEVAEHRHQYVIEVVRDARREDAEALDKVATGRVFTTGEAIENGLVDAEGYIEVAIDRAVALAGVGFERTRVRLVSDPRCTENVGGIDARTSTSVLQLSLSGRSLEENPKSSQITVASIIAALVNHGSTLVWG